MPMYSLKTEIQNDIVIVYSNGYLDDINSAVLADEINKYLAQGTLKFVISLKESPVINSQGIARMIELAEVVIDERSGELVFAELSELSSGVFKMVGLLEMTDAFSTVKEAVEAMS